MPPHRKRSRTGSHQDSLAGALPGDQASDAIIISDGEDEELGKEELKLEILQLEQRLEDQTKRTKQYEIEAVRYQELLLKCRRSAQSARDKQAAKSQQQARALHDGLGEVQDMAGAIETTQSKAKEQIDELRKSLEAERQAHAAAQHARKQAIDTIKDLEASIQKLQTELSSERETRMKLESLQASLAREQAPQTSAVPPAQSGASPSSRADLPVARPYTRPARDPRLAKRQAPGPEPGSCIFSEAYVSLKGMPGKHMDPRYHGWLPYDDAFEIKDSLTVLCDGVGEGGYRSGIFARKLVESMARPVNMDGDLFEKLEYCIQRMRMPQPSSYHDILELASSTVVALQLKPGRDSDEIMIDALELGDSQWALLTLDASRRRARCEYLSPPRFHSPHDNGKRPPYQAGMDQGHMRQYRDRKNEILQRMYARSGDIIVAGSDGFWENLGSDDHARRSALETMSEEVLGDFGHGGFVEGLGGRLRERTENRMDRSMGKKDDLTLIVSRMTVSRGQQQRGVEVRMEGLSEGDCDINLDEVTRGIAKYCSVRQRVHDRD
ncbi:hypothetical protein GUITHDRAFT_110971 [Guillardia theta CCMP2712]|uniref:PPM-type phosphatase domain-containing protein n=1 Tax=Guillardia theta (strain CCMP2712) TaxID=905079 RepID=L1J3N7_GUITC|nr:hypothetical protein GUITHDRAFT_110971 [Guillardia theta CCMP2712]EKX42922.1 hypothetical protein GUITHDRAFT_110971 [Guillardia theta CCMP2712]|eukprot:XP_005829902.1 hypothetical protein GUITHDRAFT_110971 [Guillardia theta CCMP2712]